MAGTIQIKNYELDSYKIYQIYWKMVSIITTTSQFISFAIKIWHKIVSRRLSRKHISIYNEKKKKFKILPK